MAILYISIQHDGLLHCNNSEVISMTLKEEYIKELAKTRKLLHAYGIQRAKMLKAKEKMNEKLYQSIPRD